MEYCIFPPIGIARLGNSPSFFVGPEILGSRGREFARGAETEIADFKDPQFRVKKQAARFHLYQRETSTAPFVPAALPPGSQVRWRVHLVNKKDAIMRPDNPPDAIVPPARLRPLPDSTRANRAIDSSVMAIQGSNATGVVLQGTHAGAIVRLGELRTDNEGRLLVFAGDGVSRARPLSPIGGSFYNNPNWHDDVADGPVTAEILVPGQATIAATGAWVVTTPPDFAPGVQAVVTLYDIVQQLAIDNGWVPAPTATSFTQDIYPLLTRARSLRWSHGRQQGGTVVSEPNWNDISEDFSRLADPTVAERSFRTQQRDLIQGIQTRLAQYRMTATQIAHLDRWRDGLFLSNWNGPPPVAANPTPSSLTRSALDGTAGQGFFPGIEGGRILTDRSLYLSAGFDFRIDHSQLNAGDVTALMAQPWQADFLKCATVWWPSQRPDIAPQQDGSFKLWARLGPAGNRPNHQQLVDHVLQFGMITPRLAGGVEVCVEAGRDPAADV